MITLTSLMRIHYGETGMRNNLPGDSAEVIIEFSLHHKGYWSALLNTGDSDSEIIAGFDRLAREIGGACGAAGEDSVEMILSGKSFANLISYVQNPGRDDEGFVSEKAREAIFSSMKSFENTNLSHLT